MKKMIVLLTVLAVLCSLCACSRTNSGSSLKEDLSEAGSEAENLMSEAGSEAGNLMSEAESLVTPDSSTGSESGSAQSDSEQEGPATLSLRYVTLEIPEGMRYTLGEGSSEDAQNILITLHEADRENVMTFSLSGDRTVSSPEDAVTECVRLNAEDENNDVTYGEDVSFGEITYKPVHIVHADGSASDYLVTYLQAEDDTGLYVEMKTADYPTGSEIMPLDDAMTVAFLKSIRYHTK